jgi:transposase InsO family protein
MDYNDRPTSLSARITKLKDTNYPSWKMDMIWCLHEKTLFRCVDSVRPDTCPTSAQEAARPGITEEFHNRSSKALAMIALSLEPDQKPLIRNCTTARDAWNALAAVYEPMSRSRIGKLRRNFILIHMLPNETMAKYLSRVSNAVTDLADAGKVIDDEEQAYQILNGLSVAWDSVVERLYALPDEDFIPKILRDRLLNEFERRSVTTEVPQEQTASLVLDATPYHTHLRGQGRGRGRRRGRGRGSSQPQQNYATSSSLPNIICYGCQGRGHFSRDCPSVLLSRGSRGTGRGRRGKEESDMHAMFIEVDCISQDFQSKWAFDSASTHHFCRVRSWFRNYRSIASQSAATADGTTTISGIGDVQFIVQTDDGKLTIELRGVYYAPNLRRNLISGRLVHEQGNRLASDDAGYFLRDKYGRIIMRAPLTDKFFVVSGEIVPPPSRPDLSYVETELPFPEVSQLESPPASTATCESRNEVSISRGRKKKKKKIEHHTKTQKIATETVPQEEKPNATPSVSRSATSSILNEANEQSQSNGQSQSQSKNKKNVTNQDVLKSQSQSKNKKDVTNQDVLKLWHDRMGHIAIPTLIRMSRDGKVRGMPVLKGDLKVCDGCKLGKATHAPHKKSAGVTSQAPLELVSSDVWGPSSVPSTGGARYFISFTDDYSRKTYIYTMKTKDEAFPKFKLFLAKAERSTGRKLKRLRVDNGMEYCAGYFQSELERLGIRCERTNIYSPQMNGVSERLNRTLMESVRVILITTKLPGSWWAELVTASAYVKNKVAHAGIGFEIPDARFYDIHPSVLHLKRLGSVCFLYDERRPRTKLQPRARMGILVGYALNTKGYRVWCPDENKVVIRESQSVQFDEERIGMEAIPGTQARNNIPSSVEEVKVQDVRNNQTKEQVPRNSVRPPIVRESYVDISFEDDEDHWKLYRQLNAVPQPIATQPIAQTPGTSRSNVQSVASPTPPLEPTLGPYPAPGWRRETVRRNTGPDTGRYDIYYRYLEGKRLKSLAEAGRFCANGNIPFPEDSFDYSIKNTVPIQGPPLELPPLEDTTPETEWRDEGADAEDSNHDEFQDADLEAHSIEADEPATYHEAITSPFAKQWKEAMEDEMITLKDRKAYTPIKPSSKTRTVGSRWVYTIKRDAEGRIARYRARLVAQGHTQKEGVDYHDTYSPVVNFTLVRFFFILFIVCLGWCSSHLDIKCAYFYGDLDEEIYMRPPKGFGSTSGFVWHLHKAMYGLKQSGRQWYKALDEKLKILGFTKLLATNCVYLYQGKAVMLVYVDDLLIFAKDKATLDEIVQKLSKSYRTTNLGPIRKFLGVEFLRNGNRWYMNQSRYIDKLVKRYNLQQIPNVLLPLDVGAALRPCPADIVGKVDSTQYRSLIGAMMFLALRTRPDILHSTVVLAQFSSNPSPDHWRLLLRSLAYVKSTRDLGILCRSPESQLEIVFHSDSSWASCLADRKSWSGFIGTLGGMPFSWRASKQKCVALSTMEAEFVGLTVAATEVMWLQAICQEMFPVVPAIPRKILCDNQSAIAFAKDNVEHSQTKHIDLRLKFVRDVIQEDVFVLQYVNTRENLADVFTKPLPRVCLNQFKKAISLLPISSSI